MIFLSAMSFSCRWVRRTAAAPYRSRRLDTAALPSIASINANSAHHEFTGMGSLALVSTDRVVDDTLSAVFGSLVPLPAVTVRVTLPLRGTV
jgi:hypothetical protein